VTTADGRHGELAERVAALDWYHTLELAPGVVTPGWQDTRGALAEIPIPASLEGKRCLDVGTFDGFWAFELERRGADEVVAIDVLEPAEFDWPADSEPEAIEIIGARKGKGLGFEIAREVFGSSVKRLERSVYDLTEDDAGRFDFIYLGSLLVHLRDPVRALTRLRAVCDGSLLVVDGIDLPLSLAFPRQPIARLDGRGRPWWWWANSAGLARMVEAAGFEITEGPRRVFLDPGAGQELPPRGAALLRAAPRLLRSREGRLALLLATKGDPHAVIVAQPA
jgi:tRNA (mo5U34)-methyltransferase